MKKLAILLLVFTQTILAQSFFEGTINATLKDLRSNIKYSLKIYSNRNGEIATHLKGNYKTKEGPQTIEMKQIMQPDKVFLIYNKDGRQVYSELAAGDINKLPGPFEIKTTEKSALILGYKTRKIIVNNNDKEITYITAPEIKIPLKKYSEVFQDYIFAGLARNNINEMPLKVIVKDKLSGKDLIVFDVESIVKGNIQEDSFKLPQGIEKVSLGDED